MRRQNKLPGPHDGLRRTSSETQPSTAKYCVFKSGQFRESATCGVGWSCFWIAWYCVSSVGFTVGMAGIRREPTGRPTPDVSHNWRLNRGKVWRQPKSSYLSDEHEHGPAYTCTLLMGSSLLYDKRLRAVRVFCTEIWARPHSQRKNLRAAQRWAALPFCNIPACRERLWLSSKSLADGIATPAAAYYVSRQQTTS